MGKKLSCTRPTVVKTDEVEFVILETIVGSFFWQDDSGKKISFEPINRVGYFEVSDILPLVTQIFDQFQVAGVMSFMTMHNNCRYVDYGNNLMQK